MREVRVCVDEEGGAGAGMEGEDGGDEGEEIAADQRRDTPPILECRNPVEVCLPREGHVVDGAHGNLDTRRIVVI